MTRSRLVFVFLSLSTVILLISGSMLAVAASRQDDDGSDSFYKYLAVFTEVLGLVQRAYVDETEPDSLITGAFEGVVDALDPFSLYVPADKVEAFEASRTVGVARSGLLVLKERGVTFAVAVEEGSPAAEAGIERGDILSRIQGKPTRRMPLFEIQAILAGPPETVIKIETLRIGRQQERELVLADYPRPGVELEEKKGVAVLRLAAFHAGTPKDIEVSLTALSTGTPELPGLTVKDKLLIDLRGVAGGDEGVAYWVAGLFATGELGALAARQKVVEVFQGSDEPRWQGRVAVLIDRGTQGPSEILATVLQQTIDATLVGDRSFGYAGRQSLVKLSDGGLMQITDAFYTGPDRQPINGRLEPDLRVREDFLGFEEEDQPPEDTILERGLDALLEEEAEEVAEEKLAA
ncbi:MAG: hypothetical protein GY856_23490 [bacterium]|nr:hypothetical protein [bacterium]